MPADVLRPAIELPSGLTLRFDEHAGWTPEGSIAGAASTEEAQDDDGVSSDGVSSEGPPTLLTASPSRRQHRPRAGGVAQDELRRQRAGANGTDPAAAAAAQPEEAAHPPPSFDALLVQLGDARRRENLQAERRVRELEGRVAALLQAQTGALRVDEAHLRSLAAEELEELSERLLAAMQLVTALSKEARRREADRAAAGSGPGPSSFECPVCLEARSRTQRRVLQPCGHVLCEACGSRILEVQPQRCPIARCEIYAMSPVYD